MSPAPQKALVLILAREMATQLATPMVLMDAAGEIVFTNDAADQLLGKPGDGPVASLEWGARLDLTAEDGARVRLRDTPMAVAFNDRRPAHAVLRATGADATVRTVEVTAYPLFGRADEMHGVVTIFWERAPGSVSA